ncbi:hypothetical protein LIER_04483 [Lithospermum erythrorhizon]|uniref:RRM domain-containing protein n=1 Tax=Lithospermum erythrorhizon TaxID=34254 RepID=A0AAV3NX29_LITER
MCAMYTQIVYVSDMACRVCRKQVEEPKILADIWHWKPLNVVKFCTVCDKEGDHWAARCPRKDLFEKHAHPSFKCCCYGNGMKRSLYECTFKVTNLSEDVKDSDLAELFGYFGSFNRAYVAMECTRKSA